MTATDGVDSSPSLSFLAVRPSPSSSASTSPGLRPRSASDRPAAATLSSPASSGTLSSATTEPSTPSSTSSGLSHAVPSSPSSASPSSSPSSHASPLLSFGLHRDGLALSKHIHSNYRAHCRARTRFIVCFALVSVATVACVLCCVWYRLRWGEVDHWSLSGFGVGILWLLSSVASGLATARLRAPALYSRDLNRWLRLYALEWRWKEQQLRALTPAQMARRRGKREKEQLREQERERLQAQRKAEEQAERARLLFLDQLEKEDIDSETAAAAAAAAATGGGGGRGEQPDSSAVRHGELCMSPSQPSLAEDECGEFTSAGEGSDVWVVGERRRRGGPGSALGLNSALLPVAETLLVSQHGRGLTSPDDYPQHSTLDLRRHTAVPTARLASHAYTEKQL